MPIQLPLKVLYFVHGIDGDVCKGWQRDLEWRTDDTTDAQGESFTYDMAAWQRSRRDEYAAVLADRIVAMNNQPSHYCGLNLIGHSEGTDIITLALQLVGQRYPTTKRQWVQNVMLYGGAADGRFTKNGLNAALLANQIGNVHVFTSQADEVLWAASMFWLWGPALGKSAEAEMLIDPTVRPRVRLQECVGLHHCDYFGPYRDQFYADILTTCGVQRSAS